MSQKKPRQMLIPGIYHPLQLKLVTQKWLSSFLKDPNVLGAYMHRDSRIYIVKELPAQVKLHTLYHEISHHIQDTLESIDDEEQRCDLLGSYIMKLLDKSDKVEKFLHG